MKAKQTLTMASFLVLALIARADTETVTYHYDAAGRLTAAAYEVNGTNAAIHYAYDANGNRTNLVTVAPNDTTLDSDGNGMSDLRELQYFGHLGVDGSADPDGDGLTTSNELALGANPTAEDSDGDGQSDGDEAIAGTALNDGGDVFQVANLETAPTGGARIWWNVVAGRTYQLQTRPKLTAADWTDAGAPYASDVNGPHYADEAFGTNAYYRVKVRMTP